ncbi:hypothetical protein STW0522RAO56_45660 [Raoultella planticola]|nr:hypothetical protein STW0522RAO56_45660 [Raoultella planticola]
MACFFPLYVPRHKRVHTRLTPRSFHSPSPSPAMRAASRIQHLLQSRNLPRWRCAYRGYVEGCPDKALAPPSGGLPPGGHRARKYSPVALRLPGLHGRVVRIRRWRRYPGVPATGEFPPHPKISPRSRCAYRGDMRRVARIRRSRRHPGGPATGGPPRPENIPGGAALTGATWRVARIRRWRRHPGARHRGATAARKYPPVALRLPGGSLNKALAPLSGGSRHRRGHRGPEIFPGGAALTGATWEW